MELKRRCQTLGEKSRHIHMNKDGLKMRRKIQGVTHTHMWSKSKGVRVAGVKRGRKER